MDINKTINGIFEDLMESQHSISDNPGYGYHGNVDPKIHNSKSKSSPLNGDEERARAHHYKKMHQLVRSLTGEHPKMVKHYLDSRHGRHLADVHNDNTHKKLAVGHVSKYIKKDFAGFKKHYKPDMFEETMLDFGPEEIDESVYVSSNYNKHNDHPSKSKNTFIKGVHGSEDEHTKYIAHSAGVSHESAKKIAHSPDYHKHVYDYRKDFSRGGSNGLDNGIKKLAGTHPHMKNEEVELTEWPADSGSGFKNGDKVIVKNSSSPHNNKRGIYGGTDRGRHVVHHSDGTRTVHGNGVLLKETRAELVKALVKESTKSADKKPVIVRTATGKLITKLVTRKDDIADAGGKDPDDESENH